MRNADVYARVNFLYWFSYLIENRRFFSDSFGGHGWLSGLLTFF